MQNNDIDRNDSLKEIHTTFDSDGSVKSQNDKGGLVPKILSVLAAIALWLYVFQAVEYEKTFNGIPIEIEENFGSNSGLGIVSNNTYTVDVTLSGTKSNIDNIKVEDIRAFVDLNNITEADVYTRSIEIEVPSTVDVLEKSLDQIRVEVDRTIEKTVSNITLNEIFTLESPYEIGEILITDVHKTPLDYLKLTGPETDLAAVDSAVIDLDMGNVKNSINSNINTEDAVKLYDINGKIIDTKYISISPLTISVYIPVYRTKHLEIRPDLIIDNKKFRYDLNMTSVDAYGMVDAVERIGFAETVETEISEGTVYIVALEEIEGVKFYKSGAEKNDDNIITSVSINVSAIENEKFELETETVDEDMKDDTVVNGNA